MKLPLSYTEHAGEAAGVWFTPSMSQDGRTHFTVLLRKELPDNKGLWRCSCDAMQYGHECRHIKKAKEDMRT